MIFSFGECNAGIQLALKMKTGRMRWLVVLFAVMFLANSAVAAARACLVEFAGPAHGAIQLADAAGHEHLCPVSDDAARCLTHCTQSYKSDEQKLFWSDVPGVAVAPAPAVLRVWFRPGPVVTPPVSLPPIGPPLTILFGNLRI